MAAQIMPLRRRIPGLRPLVMALTSVVGAVGVFAATIAVGGGAMALGFSMGAWLGRPGEFVGVLLGVSGPFLGLGGFVYGCHLLGTALERATKLSSPWGELAAGSDGVRWDGILRRRFTPWRAIKKVLVDGDTIVLKLRNGGAVRLLVSAPDEVARALKNARLAHGAMPREPAPASLAAIDDAETWMRNARALGDEGYRAGASPELLVRVLEDPDGAPLTRAGAALALKRAGAHVGRVRVAREASADEELRVALDAIQEDTLSAAHVNGLARRK